MNININYRLKENPNLLKYLKDNSYWYKYLNRSESYFKIFEEKMKEEYKLTSKDKLSNFSKNLDMIVKFMDILK
jgi:hypothetical protein